MYQAMYEGCDRRSRASDAARVGVAPRSGDLRKVSLGMQLNIHSSHWLPKRAKLKFWRPVVFPFFFPHPNRWNRWPVFKGPQSEWHTAWPYIARFGQMTKNCCVNDKNILEPYGHRRLAVWRDSGLLDAWNVHFTSCKLKWALTRGTCGGFKLDRHSHFKATKMCTRTTPCCSDRDTNAHRKT